MYQGQSCEYCGGQKIVGGHVVQGGSVAPLQRCPMCDGTGVQPDPGLFYAYEFTINLTAGQSLTNQSILIQDRDFKWMFFNAQSTGAFEVNPKDGSSRRPFFNQLVHSSSITGNGQNPFPLLTPFVFKRQGSIQVDIHDLSVAPNAVRLAFIGVELGSSQQPGT